jgi:hypothetical protein
MNNEKYDNIIDEAYENFVKSIEKNRPEGYVRKVITKSDFMKESEFSRDFREYWGLKIEERELSWEERSKLLTPEQFYEFGFLSPFTDGIINYYLNQKNIPTKLITITYNDKTIESYE